MSIKKKPLESGLKIPRAYKRMGGKKRMRGIIAAVAVIALMLLYEFLGRR